jgi:hypothetical protein
VVSHCSVISRHRDHRCAQHDAPFRHFWLEQLKERDASGILPFLQWRGRLAQRDTRAQCEQDQGHRAQRAQEIEKPETGSTHHCAGVCRRRPGSINAWTARMTRDSGRKPLAPPSLSQRDSAIRLCWERAEVSALGSSIPLLSLFILVPELREQACRIRAAPYVRSRTNKQPRSPGGADAHRPAASSVDQL